MWSHIREREPTDDGTQYGKKPAVVTDMSTPTGQPTPTSNVFLKPILRHSGDVPASCVLPLF